MANATGVISIGVRTTTYSASPGYGSGVIRLGVLVAASSPDWSSRAGRRERVDWLPPPHMAWIDPQTGRPTPQFYRFMHEMAENRLGGVAGSTLPAVSTAVTETRVDVANTTTQLNAVATYAEGVAATASALTEVAENNSLSGATSVPAVPDRLDRQ